MSNVPANQNQQRAVTVRPIEKLKSVMATESVQQQFRNAMAENSSLFVAQIIDLFSSDNQLQKCDPNLVIGECLKAATLKLPVNKSLGFAWIIARWNTKANAYVPQFQPGWKGIVQLAQRTGQYRHINCGPVFEGELRSRSKLTGVIDLEGEAISDTEIGYFAYIELLNGFSKTLYWTKEEVEAHAIRYNPECKKTGVLVGVWKEHFGQRAMATVLKHLIQKYGVMSIDMQTNMVGDDDIQLSPFGQIESDHAANANGDFIDVDPGTGEVHAGPEQSGGNIPPPLSAEQSPSWAM